MSGEVLVVEGSRWKLLLALAICAMFTAGGSWMIAEGEALGWLVAGFFGIGGLAIVAVTLLRGAPRLILDADGFEFTAVFRRSKIPWSAVDEFYVMRMSGAKMIGIAFSSAYTEMRRARAVAEAVSGAEGAIPDSYAKSPEELCALLNEWRQKHS